MAGLEAEVAGQAAAARSSVAQRRFRSSASVRRRRRCPVRRAGGSGSGRPPGPRAAAAASAERARPAARRGCGSAGTAGACPRRRRAARPRRSGRRPRRTARARRPGHPPGCRRAAGRPYGTVRAGRRRAAQWRSRSGRSRPVARAPAPRSPRPRARPRRPAPPPGWKALLNVSGHSSTGPRGAAVCRSGRLRHHWVNDWPAKAGRSRAGSMPPSRLRVGASRRERVNALTRAGIRLATWAQDGQPAHRVVRPRPDASPVVVGEELGLVGGHVDADRAVGLAALAGQAEVQSIAHLGRAPAVVIESPRRPSRTAAELGPGWNAPPPG